jgi:hypothetical protein
MARPALCIEVSAKGPESTAEVLRALALLQLARGVAAPRIADMIPLTPQAIRNVGRRYQDGGLERASMKHSGPEQQGRSTPV